MSRLIITVSGLRGIVGETLTPEVALRYACAFAADLPPGPIVLGRDGRSTGAMLGDAIRSGLAALGRDVRDAGVLATPTLGVLVRSVGAAGGIQVSASHNPATYNGMKLFSRDGWVIPAADGEQVIRRYETSRFDWVPHDRIGRATTVDDPLSDHLALVLKRVDVDRIRRRRFKVVLDSNHGAGGELGARLLAELGCDATILGREPTGQFAHPPEPIADHLRSVSAEITSRGADIGFCQDPDADRLAIIDAAGRYLGEEYTLALCVDHALRRQRGPIVTNCSTSRMSEDLAVKYGVPFYRSAVGEANVTTKMREVQAVFGGEGNGGPIDPAVVYVRDSFVGMALVLDALAARELPVAALAAELPQYAIEKTKLELPPEKLAPALAALERRFQDAQINKLDGLRFDWPGRWLLVRASNTEPIIRAIAEAPTPPAAADLCKVALDTMRSV